MSKKVCSSSLIYIAGIDITIHPTITELAWCCYSLLPHPLPLHPSFPSLSISSISSVTFIHLPHRSWTGLDLMLYSHTPTLQAASPILNQEWWCITFILYSNSTSYSIIVDIWLGAVVHGWWPVQTQASPHEPQHVSNSIAQQHKSTRCPTH